MVSNPQVNDTYWIVAPDLLPVEGKLLGTHTDENGHDIHFFHTQTPKYTALMADSKHIFNNELDALEYCRKKVIELIEEAVIVVKNLDYILQRIDDRGEKLVGIKEGDNG